MTDEAATGRLAAFRYRSFTLFWIGLAVSYTGVRATLAANLWLLLDLTNSAWQVGAVGLADAVAIILLTPLGGVLADRLERRTLLQMSQTFAAVVSLSMCGLTATGLVQPWHVYVAVALSSAAVTFDLPVRQAMVPALVPRAALVSALTLAAPVLNIAGLVGPAVAGLVIASPGGTAAVYLVDALAHLFLVVTLTSVRLRPTERVANVRQGLFSSFTEGIRFVARQPVLWQLMALDFVTVLFAAYRALLPVIARDILDAGATGYGLLASSVSVGSILGGAAMIRLGWASTSRRLILTTTTCYALVAMLLGQMTLFPLALLTTGLLGFLDAASFTIRNTLVQVETPDGLRGRVGAVGFMAARSGPAMGQTLMGGLATLLGVPSALVLGGCVPLLLVGGLAVFSRTLREYRGSTAVGTVEGGMAAPGNLAGGTPVKPGSTLAGPIAEGAATEGDTSEGSVAAGEGVIAEGA
ncbi:MAG: MFS transporter [Chloroflexi bacterium]|nr:MFS transporter [Chloroflexota bacterium]